MLISSVFEYVLRMGVSTVIRILLFSTESLMKDYCSRKDQVEIIEFHILYYKS